MRAYVPDDAAQRAVASVCAVFELGSRWPDWRPGVQAEGANLDASYRQSRRVLRSDLRVSTRRSPMLLIYLRLNLL